MGDGIFDSFVLKSILIATANADSAKSKPNM